MCQTLHILTKCFEYPYKAVITLKWRSKKQNIQVKSEGGRIRSLTYSRIYTFSSGSDAFFLLNIVLGTFTLSLIAMEYPYYEF